MWPYAKIVFAGTFDHLHEGHKHLLRNCFKLGKLVVIGLTSDEMITKHKPTAKIASYTERESKLRAFLNEIDESERFEIFKINTIEGGADSMEDLEALLVSDEISVVENAFRINDLREKNGLKRFHIIVVPRVRTEDGIPLSSSRIRDGEDFTKQKLIY